MIEVQNISFTYGEGPPVLKDLSMQLPRERIVAILGESGSGKTTLLNCIGRFLHPQKGRILADGADIAAIDQVAFRRMVGVVFQRLHLFPHLTALENLMLAPIQVLKQREDDTQAEALAMLERLSIAELRDAYPSHISGGQAQRVAIARSLMLKPEYLLLDEPTAALDVQTTADFAHWLLDLMSDTTFVVVTHDLPFARAVASHGVLLEAGRIARNGTVAELTAQQAPHQERYQGSADTIPRNEKRGL